MASQAWILLGCTLLAISLSTEGLDFSFVRTPLNIICGELICSDDLDQQVNSYGASKMVVYDVSGSGDRRVLASIDLNDPTNLVIDSSRASVVNGTGRISKSHADMTLDFKSQPECLHSTFVCELERSGVKGKKEVISETVTPGEQSGDCTCSAITEQFIGITNRANQIDNQMNTQLDVSGGIRSEISDFRQDLNEKQGSTDKLFYDSTLMNEAVNSLSQGHKDSLVDIAALNRINDVLLTAAQALRDSAEKRYNALGELNAKDDDIEVNLGELKQLDNTVTAGLSERQHYDAQLEEYTKSLERIDDSLNDQYDDASAALSQLQESVNILRQNDANQASDLNDLQATTDAQIRDVNQVNSEFDTQVNQIKNLQQVDASSRASLVDAGKKNTEYDNRIRGFSRNIQQYRQTFAGLALKDQLHKKQSSLLSTTDTKILQDISELEGQDVINKQSFNDLRDTDKVISEQISVLTNQYAARASLIVGLRSTDEEQQRRISNQSQRYLEVVRRLVLLTQRNILLLERLAEIKENLADVQHYILASHVTVVTRTTTKLSAMKCTRGMAHTESREQVFVNGVAVLCDTETSGGGYLIIGARKNGDVRFDGRSWDDYKNGFGRISGDYWAGLEAIRKFIRLGYTLLRIDIVYQGRKYYAQYDMDVGDESSNYRLTVRNYEGDAGDSLSYHSGSAFSTPERDNDKDARRNCAEISGGGGWWYNACAEANLHGTFGVKGTAGVFWNALSADQPLTSYEIKLGNPNDEQVSAS